MKKLSFAAALGIGTMFTASAWANCISGDCANLGYSTADVPDCENYIYCPFDINYKICAHVAPKLLDSCPAGKTCVEKYRVSGDEAASETCDDLLRTANCKRYNNGASISGDLSNQKICLFGTVTKSTGSLTLNNTIFYDAGKQFPKCESEMKGRAKLVVKGSVIMKGGSNTFNCDVSIEEAASSGGWSAMFRGNTHIKVDHTPSNTLSIHFQGDEEKITNNDIFFTCEQIHSSSSSNVYCNVNMEAINANVRYWGQSVTGTCTGSQCKGEPKITCYERGKATCKEDQTVSNYF